MGLEDKLFSYWFRKVTFFKGAIFVKKPLGEIRRLVGVGYYGPIHRTFSCCITLDRRVTRSSRICLRSNPRTQDIKWQTKRYATNTFLYILYLLFRTSAQDAFQVLSTTLGRSIGKARTRAVRAVTRRCQSAVGSSAFAKKKVGHKKMG